MNSIRITHNSGFEGITFRSGNPISFSSLFRVYGMLFLTAPVHFSEWSPLHEEFFTRGMNAVETGFFGDFSELFLCYSEWYLWGPGEGGPGV